MKTNCITLLILTLSCLVNAQIDNSLYVEYNLFDNKITYIKHNEVVLKPSVQKGENIFIKVTEFNPYITKANIEVEKLGYNQSSNTSRLKKMDYDPEEGFASSLGMMGGDLDLGTGIFSLFSSIPSSRGAAGMNKEAIMAKNKFKSLTNRTKAAEEKLNAVRSKLNMYQTAKKSRKLAVADINNLKLNPNIRPSRIREMMNEEVLYAFSKTRDEAIDIEDIVDEMHQTKQVTNTIKKYQEAVQKYQSLVTEWSSFQTSIAYLEIDDTDKQLKFINSKSDSIIKQITNNVNAVKSFDAEELKEQLIDSDVDQMAMLRQVYEELQSKNGFEYDFAPIQAEGDEVVFELTFSAKNEDNDFEPYKKVLQTVPVSGGWKVGGSVGMAFGAYRNTLQKYSIVDDVIISDNDDAFKPQVVSFVHLFRQTPNTLNYGLSFGVGLPILGGNTNSSASFFAGPTLMVGSKQRVVISGGLMGAKAQRLSNGFNVGDSFEDSLDELPLTNRYELGYFLGISFAVL